MSKINPLSFGFWVWSLSVRNDFGKPEGKIHIHKRCLSHQHLDSFWPQAKPNKMNLNNWTGLSDTLMSWVCGRKAIASASFIFHLNTLQVCLRMRLDVDLNMMQHWGWKCGQCLGRAEVVHVRTWRTWQRWREVWLQRCCLVSIVRQCSAHQCYKLHGGVAQRASGNTKAPLKWMPRNNNPSKPASLVLRNHLCTTPGL